LVVKLGEKTVKSQSSSAFDYKFLLMTNGRVNKNAKAVFIMIFDKTATQ
jgi:hypothetical protein